MPMKKKTISSDKIKLRYLHSAKRFIDDICAINHGGEFRWFICDIYPNELESKVEQQGDHATFWKFRYGHQVGNLYI